MEATDSQPSQLGSVEIVIRIFGSSQKTWLTLVVFSHTENQSIRDTKRVVGLIV